MKPRAIRQIPYILLFSLFVVVQFMPSPAIPVAGADSHNLPPTVVRVAILNASGRISEGDRVSFILCNQSRRKIEGLIGLRLELVNVSVTDRSDVAVTQIRYRPGFLHAALMMAKFLPGDQRVRVMIPEFNTKFGIDIEILVGKDSP